MSNPTAESFRLHVEHGWRPEPRYTGAVLAGIVDHAERYWDRRDVSEPTQS
jgi:hypothetical protein